MPIHCRLLFPSLVAIAATPAVLLGQVTSHDYELYPYYAVRKEAVVSPYTQPTVLPDGNLWLGSQLNGLFRWENGYAAAFPEQAETPNKHRQLAVDRSGIVWVQLGGNWTARWTPDSLIYDHEHHGSWCYPLEAGVTVLRQGDSLLIPNVNAPWKVIGTLPKGWSLAQNLSQQRAIYYTAPEKERLPRFFRQIPGEAMAELTFPAISHRFAPGTAIAAVLDSNTLVFSDARGHRMLVVRDGRIVWEHAPERRWVTFKTDGYHYWALEQSQGTGGLGYFRLWEWQGFRFVSYSFRLYQESGDFGSIARDRAGNLWFSTETGLYRLFPSIRVYEPDGFVPASITAVIEDTHGRLLLPSWGDGLAALKHGRQVETPRSLQPLMHWYMGAARVNGEVWLPNGDGQGIVRIDSQFDIDRLFESITFFTIRQSADRSVIAGSLDRGLYWLPPGRDPDVPLNWMVIDSASGLQHLTWRDVTRDTFGHIWLMDRSGLGVYIPERDTAYTWTKDKMQPDFGGVSIETDAWGNVWLGTKAGLRFYRPAQRVSHLLPILTHVLPRWLDGQAIRTVRQLGHDTLAVCTENRLFLLDLKHFYSNGAEAVPARSVRLLALDRANSGLNRGLGQNGIFPASDRGIYITTDHGLQHLQVGEIAVEGEVQQLQLKKIAFIDKNETEEVAEPHGIVLFPLNRRLVRFTLSSWSNYHYDPDSIRLIVDGRVAKTVPFLHGRPQTMEYRFDWPLLYNVEFVALRDGKVLASTHLRLQVNLGWGEAFGLVFFVLFGGLGFYFTKRARYRAERERSQLERASLQFQVLAFANQLHPHFYKNVFHPIQARISRADPALADSLSELSELLRILVDAGKHDPPGIHTLYDELMLVRRYLTIEHWLFSSDKFTFHMPSVTAIERYRNLSVPVMSVQLFVENAIVHAIEQMTDGGLIRISLQERDEYVHVIVDDNGPGFDAPQPGSQSKNPYSTGRGLVLMRSLFDVLNRHNINKLGFRLDDKAVLGQGRGVRVTVDLPKKFHFKADTHHPFIWKRIKPNL